MLKQIVILSTLASGIFAQTSFAQSGGGPGNSSTNSGKPMTGVILMENEGVSMNFDAKDTNSDRASKYLKAMSELQEDEEFSDLEDSKAVKRYLRKKFHGIVGKKSIRNTNCSIELFVDSAEYQRLLNLVNSLDQSTVEYTNALKLFAEMISFKRPENGSKCEGREQYLSTPFGENGDVHFRSVRINP